MKSLYASILACCFLTIPLQGRDYIYATDLGGNLLSVIDSSTNGVIDVVTGFTNEPEYAALTPNQNFVYVSQHFGDVAVVNTSSPRMIVTTIPVDRPYGITFTPDGRYAYIVSTTNTNVLVVNTSTYQLYSTITLPGALSAANIAMRPDGKFAYATDYDGSQVFVIDTSTLSVSAVIPFVPPYSGPYGIAITPDGTKAYICAYDSSTVAVLDLATNTVISTIPVPPPAYGIAISPNGQWACATSAAIPGFANIIDLTTGLITYTVPVEYVPTNAAFTTDSNQVYVVNANSNDISLIDVLTGIVQLSIPASEPNGIAIGPAVAPPNGGDGVQNRAKFLTQTFCENTLTWTPPGGPNPAVAYIIYGNAELTKKLGTVPASANPSFTVCCKKKNTTYYIVAVDAAGDRSPPLVVKI